MAIHTTLCISLALVLFTFDGLYSARAQPDPPKPKKRCQRLEVPHLYVKQYNSAHNPAATWTDDNGWLVFAHHSSHARDSQQCTISDPATPLLMYLGKSYGPETALAKFTTHEWGVNTSRIPWHAACTELTESKTACEDPSALSVYLNNFRPYQWNHQVWILANVHMHNTKAPDERYRVVQGIVRPNWGARQLELDHVCGACVFVCVCVLHVVVVYGKGNALDV